MGNQEALDILKQKLDDIVKFISKNNSIGLKDVENISILKMKTKNSLCLIRILL
jgi:phosphate starvation-inducible PhoH-like protein